MIKTLAEDSASADADQTHADLIESLTHYFTEGVKPLNSFTDDELKAEWDETYGDDPPKPKYTLPLTDEARQALKTELAQIRYDGMFGDGMETEYIWEGVTIVGLNQMSDEDLRAEYIQSTGGEET